MYTISISKRWNQSWSCVCEELLNIVSDLNRCEQITSIHYYEYYIHSENKTKYDEEEKTFCEK